jgi:hypothetical protein
MKGRDNLEDLSVNGRVMLKCLKIRWEATDWAHLAQDRNQ